MPPYIKDPRGWAGRPRGVRQESPTPSGSRIPPPPPILVGIGFLEGGKRERGPATSPSPNRTRGEARGPPRAAPFSFPLKPTKAHTAPGGVRKPSSTPVKSRFHPEHFRYPNIGFQYINLYVSTISRLLFMSPISSGTPNSFGTSKLINS